jgi:FtsP/CotA-like multicopper oxidase with cupredoxin domain
MLSGAVAACATLSVGPRSRAAQSDTRELWLEASGFDGAAPGPALRVRRGEDVHVRLVNGLPEPTAVHWHGVRLANAMDGAPPLTQTPIAPGESFDYRFAAPDAGTFWYHPPGPTRRGLYGVLVVTEKEPIDVDHDLTLVFGAIVRPGVGASNTDPPPLTVNGASNFGIGARANERLRLRLVNACDTELLVLQLTGLRAVVMATDGQPATPFAARDSRLSLGPGNRIDVFVDCTLAPGAEAPIAIERAAGAVPAIRIKCETGEPGRKSRRDDPLPLPPNALPESMHFAGALRLDTAIGLDTARRDAPMFTAIRGRTVVVGVSNPTSENSFIHLHGHSFRLLDALDDGWKPFWLDTMPVAPRAVVRIAFVADNPGKWPLEGLAADNRPAAWFEVT